MGTKWKLQSNYEISIYPFYAMQLPTNSMIFFCAHGCNVLSQILSEHRSITSYLQKFHPDEDGPFGITVQCLETFIKSCAGYSVITYILGVGDRFVCLLFCITYPFFEFCINYLWYHLYMFSVYKIFLKALFQMSV